MAPRPGVRRRTASVEPQGIFEFGKQGRTTGVVLPDNNVRDEYGMQPIDSIFSSPRKGRGSSSARSNRTRDDSEGEDMEIASSDGPGPQTVLRRSLQYPIPRSRSPVKTNLKSPARKSQVMDRRSSPERESTVTRGLFQAKNPGTKRGQPFKSARTNGVNGSRRTQEVASEEDEAEDVEYGNHPPTDDIINESIRMVEEWEEEPPAVGDEPEDEVRSPPRSGGSARKRPVRRPFSSEAEAEVAEVSEEEGDEEEPEQIQLPSPRRPGRPPKKDAKGKAPANPRASKKRPAPQATQEPESEDDRQQDEGDRRQPKKPRTTGGAAKSAKGKGPAAAKAGAKPGRPKGRPKQVRAVADDAEVGDTSIAALQRGPPMPKGRGLVSVRHEEGMKQTRSGRHSYRPLAFWRGEAAVAEREDYDDMFQKDRHFVLPSVKEVVRVEPDVAPSKRAPRSKSRAKTKSKSTAAQEEDEELEEWETNPGTVHGEVVQWEPEHELHPPAEDEPVHIAEEQIAISGDAVETRDIKDATFRFAKTLTKPFMGAGIVDLPPGAEKRPKNSRKMHMVFFVHYGKVMVTVNEAQFRISPGGTWLVPRGNYYSITNDYDNPARIFFAQACEVPAQPLDLQEE